MCCTRGKNKPRLPVTFFELHFPACPTVRRAVTKRSVCSGRSLQPAPSSVYTDPPSNFITLQLSGPIFDFAFQLCNVVIPSPSTKWPTTPPTRHPSRHALYRHIGVAIQLHRVTFFSLWDHAPSPSLSSVTGGGAEPLSTTRHLRQSTPGVRASL